MTTTQPLTELEQEVFDYLNAIPNFNEARIESIIAFACQEHDIRWSLAKEIVEKWIRLKE